MPLKLESALYVNKHHSSDITHEGSRGLSQPHPLATGNWLRHGYWEDVFVHLLHRSSRGRCRWGQHSRPRRGRVYVTRV